MCESRGLGPACHTGSMYYNVADSGSFPMLSLLESANHVCPSFPAIHGELPHPRLVFNYKMQH
jgi:hypothetical protein